MQNYDICMVRDLHCQQAEWGMWLRDIWIFKILADQWLVRESRIQLMILQNRAIASGSACSSRRVDIGNTKEVENLEETASRMHPEVPVATGM